MTPPMRTPFRVAALAALLALAAPSARADTFDVNQTGFTFSPQAITIHVGDTVVWHWNDGVHTVTSGTGGVDPQAGSLFDASLNSSVPTVSHTFDSEGDVAYFCRFHESLGMTGTVHVRTTVPAEQPSWGMVKARYP